MNYINMTQNSLMPDEHCYLTLEESFGRVDGELHKSDALTGEHFDEVPLDGG